LPKLKMKPNKISTTMSRVSRPTTLSPGERIGEGDSRVIYNELAEISGLHDSVMFQEALFSLVKNEVYWQKMYHHQGEVPRLVCVQGTISADGTKPVYRHPSDQSMPLLKFSPTVQLIQKHVESVIGHPMNHVLIQLYRSGQDYISEHSDKTLDIVRGSYIVNVSLGAQRTMKLRTKKSAASSNVSANGSSRHTQIVPLPHASIFVLGPDTNTRWLHGINADKRPISERSESEKAYGGERISLTFRHIGTFLDEAERTIWGQGARSKRQCDAREVVNGNEAETAKVIHAFGTENQSTFFDWDSIYGLGFDVLHFTKQAPP